MNYHNSKSYVRCESEFDSVSVPLAKKVDADVYVIESDKQEALEHVVTRLSGISEESWDYGGVYYTNCFRSNKPIMLTSLGFFGPDLPKGFNGRVSYSVDIQIELMRKALSQQCKISKRFSGCWKVTGRDDVLYFNFPKPVSILPYLWYAIKFRLEGPRTLRGMYQLDRVETPEGIAFDFFQGSLQMPVLKYVPVETVTDVV